MEFFPFGFSDVNWDQTRQQGIMDYATIFIVCLGFSLALVK